MKLLLDTHTVVWFINCNPRLPRHIREMLDDEFNSVYVSVVSLWEISIKFRLGKLELNGSLANVVSLLRSRGFQFLKVDLDHVFRLDALAAHHRDPFDRMLIAQALAEDFALVSCDDVFDFYEVRRLWSMSFTELEA